MKIDVRIEPNHKNGWRRFEFEGPAGRQGCCWLFDPWRYSTFTSKLRSAIQNAADFEALETGVRAVCRDNNHEFAAIIAVAGKCLAAVDHIQSEPLFYAISGRTLVLTNEPDRLLSFVEPRLRKLQLREFMLSNWVSGADTLLRNLFQVEAGRLLVSDGKAIGQEAYYEFWHREPAHFSVETATKEFRDLILATVEEFLEPYRDHRIVLMLSGGLDSRLVLWALDTLKAPDVLLCSYGRSFQRDVVWAKRFASLSSFEWKLIPLTYRTVRKAFQSADRKAYSQKRHFFSRLPFLQDYPAIKALQATGELDRPTIFVTGNSGDYVSGAHIQETLSLHNDVDVTIEAILTKHHSRWPKDHLSARAYQELQEKIEAELRKAPASDRNEANLFEWWEWRERQSKFIVNSKKLYQWLDLELFLPLWDKRVMRFFETAPFRYRRKQQFYSEFCHSLVTPAGAAFSSVPVTQMGRVRRARRARRAFEFLANPKWGRYSLADLRHILSAAKRVLGTCRPPGLPNIDGSYNALILWEIMQHYQIEAD